uniref:Uncharacterized protein n=1 Tax=Physcomitrium patens TaxID=3218 RepID=A0A2K1J8V7_PHYPA|nr:hypothetical protein PHYPA_021066 [Physcomitrium patens]
MDRDIGIRDEPTDTHMYLQHQLWKIISSTKQSARCTVSTGNSFDGINYSVGATQPHNVSTHAALILHCLRLLGVVNTHHTTS